MTNDEKIQKLSEEVDSLWDSLNITTNLLKEQKKDFKKLEDKINSLTVTKVEQKNILEIDYLMMKQIPRCNLVEKWRNGELSDENLDYELSKMETVFEDKEIQHILDFFNFQNTLKIANQLGHTLGLEERPITQFDLIKNAIECFKDMCLTRSGRSQRGRLIVHKMWDFDNECGWYDLVYCVDFQEAF